LFMAVVITLNAGLIVYETDLDAQCFPTYAGNLKQCPHQSAKLTWSRGLNTGLLCLYSVEYLLRLYVFRRSFFYSNWALLDGFVVLAGWAGMIFENTVNLAFLRLIRIARLSRVIRVVTQFRELIILLNGLMSSMRAIFFGSVLMFCMLIGFGILMVEVVHPTNSQITWTGCKQCSAAFRSVGHSTMTLYRELVMGGTWITSFTLMEKDPAAILLIIVTSSTITLGILNLILTVIVEQAATARENDSKEEARLGLLKQHQAKEGFLLCCKQFDKNGDGKIRLGDLLDAGEASEEVHSLMRTMDLRYPS